MSETRWREKSAKYPTG